MGTRSVGPRRVEGPKFRAFFSLLPPQFSFFLLSLGGPFVEFWWCLKRRGPEMCTFGVLGPSCEAPAPERAHKIVPAFKKHHQNSTKGPPRERRKKEKCGWRREKRAKFWAVRRRGVRVSTQILDQHTQQTHTHSRHTHTAHTHSRHTHSRHTHSRHTHTADTHTQQTHSRHSRHTADTADTQQTHSRHSRHTQQTHTQQTQQTHTADTHDDLGQLAQVGHWPKSNWPKSNRPKSSITVQPYFWPDFTRSVRSLDLCQPASCLRMSFGRWVLQNCESCESKTGFS